MAHKDYKWKGQALKQHLNSQKPSDFFHLCFSLCIYSIFFEPTFLCFSSPVPNEHDNLSPWFYPVKECTLQTPDLITYYLGVRAKLLGSNKGNSAWATEGLRACKPGTKKPYQHFSVWEKKLLKGLTYHGCPGFCFLGMSLVIPSLLVPSRGWYVRMGQKMHSLLDGSTSRQSCSLGLFSLGKRASL